MLASGALEPLIKIVEDPDTAQNIIKSGVWMISNLCRGRPPTRIEKVKSAIPTLCKIIQSQTDEDILTDATEALSYLSRNQVVIEDLVSFPKTISALISQLSNPYIPLMLSSLKIIGQICTGNEAQTDVVIDDPEFFENMYHLIDHKKRAVRREAIWTLSNIAAGTEKQKSKLLQSFPFVEKLVPYIKTDIDEIGREALYVFSNSLKHENISDFFTFKNAGLLDCCISILKNENNCLALTLKVVLEGVHFMLKIGRKIALEDQSEQNMVLDELEKAGALNKLDTLQDYHDTDVNEIVTKIIQEFIPSIEIKPQRTQPEDDDDDDDEDDDEEDLYNFD